MLRFPSTCLPATQHAQLRETQDLALRLRLRYSTWDGNLQLFRVVAAVKLDAVSRLDPVVGITPELAIWTY